MYAQPTTTPVVAPATPTRLLPSLTEAEDMTIVLDNRGLRHITFGQATDEQLLDAANGAAQNYKKYGLSLQWRRWSGALLVLMARENAAQGAAS